MATEPGDTKLIGNLSKLMELVSANPDYKPAAKLKVPALTAQKTTRVSDRRARIAYHPGRVAYNTIKVQSHPGPYRLTLGNQFAESWKSIGKEGL